MDTQKLKEKVIQPIVKGLKDYLGLEVRGAIFETFSTIEFLKDNTWQRCVKIAHKGYSLINE